MIELEPTAALVMDLGKDLFMQDQLTRNYFEHLDLSSAKEIVKDYQDDGIYELACELMCNRKNTVREATLEFARKNRRTQVVIMAAGKTPLGMELLSREENKISAVFELDVTPFDEKRRLLQALRPQFEGRMHFLVTDILAPNLIKRLEKAGLKQQDPVVVVLEGITHFLSAADLKTLLSVFRSSQAQNLAVIEYGPPFETLAEWVRPKAERAFRNVEKRHYQQGMTKHSVESLTELLHGLGGRLNEHYPMNVMEKMRTKTNRHFKEHNSGWVEVLTGHI